VLDSAQRHCVEASASETCKIRKWKLYAINVRTNHVHLVVSIGETKPEIALNAFKANATREMRKSACWQSARSPWSDKGSKRYLWNEKSLAQAIDYVLNGQGDDLPDFDK
jgi:REP element-mobilizing transposase RayT